MSGFSFGDTPLGSHIRRNDPGLYAYMLDPESAAGRDRVRFTSEYDPTNPFSQRYEAASIVFDHERLGRRGSEARAMFAHPSVELPDIERYMGRVRGRRQADYRQRRQVRRGAFDDEDPSRSTARMLTDQARRDRERYTDVPWSQAVVPQLMSTAERMRSMPAYPAFRSQAARAPEPAEPDLRTRLAWYEDAKRSFEQAAASLDAMKKKGSVRMSGSLDDDDRPSKRRK